MTFTPFADDGTPVTVGRLTVEHRTNSVTLYGSLDVTRDSWV